jgi:hypothetical protein
MIKIRHAVFETNSSSTHSISIQSFKPIDGILDTIYPDSNGNITLFGGEFGWEEETYNDALTKANYCAVDAEGDNKKLEMLSKLIKQHTGAKEVIYELKNSYIDHQSQGTSYKAFSDLESLRAFIFNPNSILQTDNDNH